MGRVRASATSALHLYENRYIFVHESPGSRPSRPPCTCPKTESPLGFGWWYIFHLLCFSVPYF